MSENKVIAIKSENEKNNEPVKVELDAVIIRTVEDAAEDTKKCCCQIKNDACICLRCMVKTWSFCLNGIEGCCSALSTCCLFSSSVAIGCNKCLEQMDCDGH